MKPPGSRCEIEVSGTDCELPSHASGKLSHAAGKLSHAAGQPSHFVGQPEQSESARLPVASLPRFARCFAALLGLGPLLLLGVAMSLRPSEAGLGTHQQLGLPPCSMRVIFGIRCPACGMTTSWSYFTRGQWWQSVSANPGGFLLAVYCIPFAACCFFAAAKGRLPQVATQNAMIFGLLVIAIVSVAHWLARLGGLGVA
jgi:hypothetical protein